ncbi:MAG TPA: hypothetical protein VFQ99_00050 [Gallionella sp.]|nr:hypothetical protein [Gallionella sp.]
MFHFSRIAIVLLISMLAACGTVQVGQDFDVHAFETKIERGISTQNQVRAWLGAPAGTGVTWILAANALTNGYITLLQGSCPI